MRHHAKNLLKHYIDLHNDAARGGSERALERILSDDFVIDVEGPCLSEPRSRAIIASFRQHELVLWKIGHVGADVAFASYAWKSSPRLGGLVRVQCQGGRISHLTLRPGYSRIFAILSEEEDSAPESNPFVA